MDIHTDLTDFSNRCRLFPLPNLVLFPHAVLPLHIFEPRYRQMTEDALAGDQLVTIVQIKPKAPGSSMDRAGPHHGRGLPWPDRAARTTRRRPF